MSAALAVGRSLETVDDDIPGAAAPASVISGTLDERNDPHDVFRVFLSLGETLTVGLDGAAGSDFDILLFTPGARSMYLDSPVAGSQAATYPDAFSYVATAAGYHYLDTDAFSGRGSYTLTYTTTMPTGDLSGTVTSSGSALAGVLVSVPGYADTLTPADGTYLIAGMSTGTHDVTYSKSGYSNQTHAVTVSASGATQDVAMLVAATPATAATARTRVGRNRDPRRWRGPLCRGSQPRPKGLGPEDEQGVAEGPGRHHRQRRARQRGRSADRSGSGGIIRSPGAACAGRPDSRRHQDHHRRDCG